MSRRAKRALLGAALVALLLAAAACTRTASSPNTVTVVIKDLRFNPRRVTIRPGMSVRWLNRDTTAHTSTSADFDTEAGKGPAGSWNSPVLDPGKSWTHKFDKKGSFDYACAIHPYIKGTVEVK